VFLVVVGGNLFFWCHVGDDMHACSLAGVCDVEG